ncbi:hypothetical protein HED60_02895 [Planctomycetales bacterium ZRK34]|nr:hypothetical protein HED60_02895 [Planctomycetales bacterium ZRK34]
MNTPQLNTMLRRTGRQDRTAAVTRGFGFGAAVVLAAGLIAIVLDALLGLNTLGLIALDLLLLALIITAVVQLSRLIRHHRYDARRIARLIEQRLGLTHSDLINAVDFAERDDPHTSDALRRMAIQQGETAAAQVAAASVIDRRPVKRAMLAANLVIFIALLAFMLMPGLFRMVVPRLLNPTADLPPYTLINFDVQIEPNAVYYNKPATIIAKLTGPVTPQRASVVFIDEDGRHDAPMLRREADQFALPLGRVTEPRTFYIDTPDGRSQRYTLNVLPTPLFEKSTLHLQYPAYTSWPPTTHPLTDQGIRALVGTTAVLTIESNLPLQRGEMLIRQTGDGFEQTIPLTPNQGAPNQIRGSFTIQGDGEYTLTLFAADGTPSDKPMTGPIVAVEDRAPTVRLIEPDLRVMAPEGWKLPVEVSAGDDVAIERVTLQHRTNGGKTIEHVLTLSHRGPTSASGRYMLDLAELGAGNGDVIRGFATAYDNRPGAAQSADSPTFEVRVITEAEYKELARRQIRAKQIADELAAINAQADKLEAARQKLIEQLEALKAGDADPQKLDAARKQLDAYEQDMRDLAEKMRQRIEQPSLYEFEEPMKQTLAERAEKLQQQADETARAGKRLGGQPSGEDIDAVIDTLRRQQNQNNADKSQQQLTQQQIRQMALADAMMQQAERIIGIADQQRDLAERLAAFREKSELSANERARIEQLGRNQRELGRQLRDALIKLSEAAEEAEHELPKMSQSSDQLVQKIRELKIVDDQMLAAEHAELGRGFYAAMHAAEASRKLESLIGQCNGVGQCASDDLDGLLGLSRSQLQQALDQMAQGRQGSRGSSSGTGAGGASGTASGGQGSQTGDASGNQATLAGPNMTTAGAQLGESKSTESRSFNQAGGGDGAATAGDAETIDPTARTIDAPGAGGVRGVPTPYRDLAERYFRRLAEDSK